MRFGPVPVDEAEGAILAHTVVAGDLRLGKARRLTGADIAALTRAGVATVVAAVLEAGDLDEDAAAARIADALAGPGFAVGRAATGRVNFHASRAGVFAVDRAAVDAVNAIDPAVTLATLPEWTTVGGRQMVATVKIIPFAVPSALVEAACRAASVGQLMAVHGFRAARVGLVQSRLAGTKESVLDKTAAITRERLARSGSRLAGETRVAHEPGEIAGAISAMARDCAIVVVFGASAVSDEADAIPEAIRRAGGNVERTGMPVDPGNLLVLGSVGETFVLGAPGCARSPKTNGFDWVLDRLLAGIPVSGADIAAMGVGGLLAEIGTRPRPREKAARSDPKLWGLLLAAGRSTRMGDENKLLAVIDGMPLVRVAADNLADAALDGLVCVVGHEAGRVREALSGLDFDFVENVHYAEGMSTSLKAGIAALPEEAGGVLVALGDMPAVTAVDIGRLAAAFKQAGGQSVVRATNDGRPGNPVILPRSMFLGLRAIEGDAGARRLIEAGNAPVVDVEIGAGSILDLDTPAELAGFRDRS